MPAPPPAPAYVLAIQRLAKLTASGAAPRAVENQVADLLQQWTLELTEDRGAFRDRLNELEEGMASQIDAVAEDLGDLKGAERTLAEKQILALRAAQSALREAQERLGV